MADTQTTTSTLTDDTSPNRDDGSYRRFIYAPPPTTYRTKPPPPRPSVIAPLDVLCGLLGGRDTARARAHTLLDGVVYQPSIDETSGYTVALLNTIQNCTSDEQLGCIPIAARNKFGVTLLHKACRYPNWIAARFIATRQRHLITSSDDLGRLPLHDACWNEKIDFDVIELLVAQAPASLLAPDNRGHTPLCYVPRKLWPSWNEFVHSKRHLFRTTFFGDSAPFMEAPAALINSRSSDTDDDPLESLSSSSSSSDDTDGRWQLASRIATETRHHLLRMAAMKRARSGGDEQGGVLKKVVSSSDVSTSEFSSSETVEGAAPPTPPPPPRCWSLANVLGLNFTQQMRSGGHTGTAGTAVSDKHQVHEVGGGGVRAQS